MIKNNILHWLSILIQNRTFSSNSVMEIMSKKFLMEKYNIDISEYDLIMGIEQMILISGLQKTF